MRKQLANSELNKLDQPEAQQVGKRLGQFSEGMDAIEEEEDRGT